MAEPTRMDLPAASSALNVIQDLAESAPDSPSSASSFSSPLAAPYELDIEDLPRSAFGTPSIEPSGQLPPLPTRSSPSASPVEVRRIRRERRALRDQVRRHELLRAQPGALQQTGSKGPKGGTEAHCPKRCITCADSLEGLCQSDPEAVMVTVVLSTAVAATAGVFLSPILAGVAITVGGSAGILFLVRSRGPRLHPRPKSSSEFL
ncbi:hypothetical protein FOL47_009340 [Perkinsus chesapeaki]|uniref:Uncharacterized protein n=1 Tax=Perkinsus chesapeaki TaxID=330153 RepID=A0A7J6L8Z0_PERCH|nr:hypothetical protein FOL47_009340 [Perkinsus chesapeaki]